jgi:hypothetical protein
MLALNAPFATQTLGGLFFILMFFSEKGLS